MLKRRLPRQEKPQGKGHLGLFRLVVKSTALSRLGTYEEEGSPHTNAIGPGRALPAEPDQANF